MSMTASDNAVAHSRVLVPLLGVVVWLLIYFHAHFAYRMARGAKKRGYSH
jgi:hypothetical protein